MVLGLATLAQRSFLGQVLLVQGLAMSVVLSARAWLG